MILSVEKKLCKTCSEVKTCILVGKFDARNKKYTDESGSYWNGKVCPQCNKVRVRENMRKKRETDKLVAAQLGENAIVVEGAPDDKSSV